MARLEEIRRQNYLERKRIQNRVSMYDQAPPTVTPPGVPIIDQEARRKKIAALKVKSSTCTCSCCFGLSIHTIYMYMCLPVNVKFEIHQFKFDC